MKVFWGCSQLRKWMISEVSGWSVTFHELSRSFFSFSRNPTKFEHHECIPPRKSSLFLKLFWNEKEGSWGFLRISDFGAWTPRFVSQRLGADRPWVPAQLGFIESGHTRIITFRFCRILWITWLFFLLCKSHWLLKEISKQLEKILAFSFGSRAFPTHLTWWSLQALSGLDHLWPSGRCANCK